MIPLVSRGFLARKRFQELKRDHAAILIQKIARGWIARKRYHAKRNYIISVQTCIRRRNARKQLVVLRAEARSVSHLKEASYKLESRVVDLIDNLSKQREEKTRLKSKAIDLENQVKSWMQRYERLDQKAKDVEAVAKPPQVASNDIWATLRNQRDQLQADYIASLNKIKSQDKDLTKLREELLHQRDEITKLRNRNQNAKKTSDSDIGELKNQISALKTATDYKLFVQ